MRGNDVGISILRALQTTTSTSQKSLHFSQTDVDIATFLLSRKDNITWISARIEPTHTHDHARSEHVSRGLPKVGGPQSDITCRAKAYCILMDARWMP